MPQEPSLTSDMLSLLLASAALMGSPGPSTISATAVAAAHGYKHALGYISGLIAGTWLVLLAVASGLAVVIASEPRIAQFLTGLSIVYVGYLAWRIASAPPLAGTLTTERAPSFVGGFLLAAANPKAFLAIGAVFAGFSLGQLSPTEAVLLKTALLAGMVLLIHVVWAVIGLGFARVLRHPVASRTVNIALAVILVVAAALSLIPR